MDHNSYINGFFPTLTLTTLGFFGRFLFNWSSYHKAMAVFWSYLVSIEFIIYAALILTPTIRQWTKAEFKETRFNNFLYGIMYLILAFMVPTIFASDGLTPALENRLFMYLFFVLIAIDLFWWGLNLGPNLLYCRRHPEEKLKPYRQYGPLVEQLKDHKKSSLLKDITRKFLHILMMGIVIVVYVYARSNQATIESDWGFENYWSFAKFVYLVVAYGFCNMFVLGDLLRMNAFHGLPGWARKWYGTSLEHKEAYTFITSIPYILSVSMLVWTPLQMLMIGLCVSAIGDGAASIIGKAFGKHKFPAKLDTKKSFEGLFAGCSATLISTIIIVSVFPFPNHSFILALTIGTMSMMIFAMTDMFGQHIPDNITNTLLPALVSWGIAILFGAFV